MMTVPELRKHVGKMIEWEECHDHHRGTCLVRRGRLTELKGRNVNVNDGDWKWLPDLHNLKVIE